MEATFIYWKPCSLPAGAGGLRSAALSGVAGQGAALGGSVPNWLYFAWLARITEQGSLAGKSVLLEDIRRLRTHTVYRRRLIQARTAEKARCEKLLEDVDLSRRRRSATSPSPAPPPPPPHSKIYIPSL